MSGSRQVQKMDGQRFAEGFAKVSEQVKAVLPAHVPFDKFERVVRIAVQKNPKLLECRPASLFMECVKAASDGLLPDGREGAIVPRWNSKEGCNMATWMPMVAGLMKLARNSGQIASISSQVVFEGEKFHVVMGDDERIEHERDLSKTDGNIVAVYAIARLKDGSDPIREVMSWKQVEKVRATNKDWQKGPWASWSDEMARKTAIRRLVKRLPLSTDKEAERFEQAVQRVDGLHDLTPEPAVISHDDPADPFQAAALGHDTHVIPDLTEQLAGARSFEEVQAIEEQVTAEIDRLTEAGDKKQADLLGDAHDAALKRVEKVGAAA